MFEIFNIEDLYYCTIDDITPLGMQNLDGWISIDASSLKIYNTIVYLKDGKYYDINHLDRIINVINYPQYFFPEISKNKHLYAINEKSLISYREKNNTNCKVLQRLPLGRKRHLL